MTESKIYVPKDKVAGVLSLARSMQDLSDSSALEARVNERLPVQYNEEGIPEDVMYEMGELENLKSEYVQRAIQFYSGDAQGIFETLRGMGAVPSKSLRAKWLERLVFQHEKSVIDFLNNQTNPNEKFKSLAPIRFGYKRKYALGYGGWFDGKKISTVVDFDDSEDNKNPVSANVTLTTFTPKMLEVLSGSVRNLTLQMPGINSYKVIYNPTSDSYLYNAICYQTSAPY